MQPIWGRHGCHSLNDPTPQCCLWRPHRESASFIYGPCRAHSFSLSMRLVRAFCPTCDVFALRLSQLCRFDHTIPFHIRVFFSSLSTTAPQVQTAPHWLKLLEATGKRVLVCSSSVLDHLEKRFWSPCDFVTSPFTSWLHNATSSYRLGVIWQKPESQVGSRRGMESQCVHLFPAN